jgi:ADP-heptose:LPS heptosyltransferase
MAIMHVTIQRRVFIHGMQGMGDSFYQRAVVKPILEKAEDVWLETSWPAIYHDMPRLKFVASNTRLRTQAKSVNKNLKYFVRNPMGTTPLQEVRVHYPFPIAVQLGGLPQAMAAVTHIETDYDYRMTVPAAWQEAARKLIGYPEKPILVVRPLTVRTEWNPITQRNPDTNHYFALYNSIRKYFHVVSVADLEKDREWLIGPELWADHQFYEHPLPTETLIGLFSIANLVMAAPGFALAMAQATGTPVVIVFGGMESSYAHRSSTVWAPFLGIDPINPCNCWSAMHSCNKKIDMVNATKRLMEFLR